MYVNRPDIECAVRYILSYNIGTKFHGLRHMVDSQGPRTSGVFLILLFPCTEMKLCALHFFSQSAFFQTPFLAVTSVGVLVVITFAVCISFIVNYGKGACIYTEKKMLRTREVYVNTHHHHHHHHSDVHLFNVLFIAVYILQLAVLTCMTYLFTRPLIGSYRFARPSNLTGRPSLYSSGDVATSSVVVDVVRRTAIGSGIHIITSVIYLALFISLQVLDD